MIRGSSDTGAAIRLAATNGGAGRNRQAYNFSGGPDRGDFPAKLIDPDADILLGFTTGQVLPPAGVSYTVLAQNITTTSANRELGLYTSSANALQLMVGGVFAPSMGEPLAAMTRYVVQLVGNQLTYFKNGEPLAPIVFNRGAAREPGAVTRLAARNTSANTFGSYYRGQLFDVMINGTIWPISEAGETEQGSAPVGTTLTLVNADVTRWSAV